MPDWLTAGRPLICRPNRLAALRVLAGLTLWLLTSPAPADVLLLHNGNLLSGQVTRQLARWQVELEGGGTISLPMAAVRFHGPDVASAYQHQRRIVRSSDGPGLAKLIDWSLRHGLFDVARRDLDQLRLTDPDNPRRVTLERRWQESAQSSPTLAEPNSTRLAQPAMEPAAADPRASSKAELKLAGLTAAQLVDFARQAYPVLHQRCGGGGCHSAVAGNLDRPFRLYDRHSLIGAMRRNLASTAEWVDARQPDASPLLRYAQQAHGTRNTPPLDKSDQQALERLRSWVTTFAASAMTPHGTGVAAGTTAVDSHVAPASAVDPLDPGAFNRATSAAATAEEAADKDDGTDAWNPDESSFSDDSSDADAESAGGNSTLDFSSPQRSATGERPSVP